MRVTFKATTAIATTQPRRNFHLCLQPCSPRPSRQDHHRRPRNRVHSLRHIHLPSRSVPEPTPTTSCHPFPLLQKLLELTKEIGRLLREKQERLGNQASNRKPDAQ